MYFYHTMLDLFCLKNKTNDMKLKMLRVMYLSIIIVAYIFGAMPVDAISTSPTQLTINWVYVYKNCLELNDMGFWVDYTATYASTPTETIDTTYVVRLVNSSGADIRAVKPYTYFTKGYNEGLSFIFIKSSS